MHPHAHIQPRRRHLARVELAALFEQLEPRPFWAGYFQFQFEFGCAESEPALCRQSDVDMVGACVTVRRLKRRSVEGGVLPCTYALPGHLVAVLEAVREQVRAWGVPEENPWFWPSRRVSTAGTTGDRLVALRNSDGFQAICRSAADRAFRQAATGAGIPDGLAHTHVLRHTRAVFLLADGVPPKDVQAALGHRDLATTLSYLPAALRLRQESQ